MPRKAPMDRGMSRLTLHITQELLDDAMRKSSTRCAVAEAVKAQVPAAGLVWVDKQYIGFTQARIELVDGQEAVVRKRYNYRTPRYVGDYIECFDAGNKVAPFDVNLRDPQVTFSRATNRYKQAKDGKAPNKAATRKYVREYGERKLRTNQHHQPSA